ncbi:NAD-dependent succinate-semialdehyde dehydrogenase [Pandoraea pnomenusa]|uniref:Succinate-semialdehyde dehydrogenase n=1 Tax=Pandoraea pnomenusa TaxID=93220 RepID=A0ABY6WMZ0_9BURK|nr:NAD-dependent succinate-semialdehyde dehydrogenase [Pandoraea pnomenusa]AHB05369.1 succinate-semialdehyde dehydrogenase [Pandoraea pnomenusa 3kgm]ANC43315.1 NAD-dependent succinate-semialdehyde dehydrogenase [Pandoraea pnomenusa]VVE70235.1 succinate-semialdehyde dehydrogenase [Pandoraea pnomenusa]
MLLDHPVLFKSLCYIDGRWTHSDDAASIAVVDPADQSTLGHVPMLTREQIGVAVDAAERAFSTWRWTPAAERCAALQRWHALIRQHAEDLAVLLAHEQGKPLHEARGEIGYGASFIEWYGHEARRLDGRTITSHIEGAQLGTVREPVGVAALITPWNFPFAMITRKAAAALAAGCTVVVKPAHETPFSALALAQLADEAGLPPGLFNVVLGEPDMAMRALVGDARVRAVSFTGSTRVGQRVAQAAAASGVKKLALELGGNAPFIVLDDVDIDEAVRIAVAAKFQTSGQDCCAANRIFVARTRYGAFVDRYTQAVARLRVGPAFSANVDVGPLMHQAAFEATAARVEDARRKGAQITVGGEPHPLGGWFYRPTVVADAAPGMRIYDEENFGPISAVCAFDSLDEVVTRANDTEYGLAAYVCGRRVDEIFTLIRRLDFAMVSVNGVKFTGAPVPFGGMKASGLGREGGVDGFEPFTETKYFCLGNLGIPMHRT